MIGALNNPEEKLSVAVRACLFFVFSNTSRCPFVCSFHGAFGVIHICIIWGAFVKCHDDIGTEFVLDADGFFWCESMCTAIEMRSEGNAVVIYIYERAVIVCFKIVFFFFLFAKRKYLKTATIGKDWFVPVHEFV